eukprot:1062116-Prorocentrum_minimum.AAC.1
MDRSAPQFGFEGGVIAGTNDQRPAAPCSPAAGRCRSRSGRALVKSIPSARGRVYTKPPVAATSLVSVPSWRECQRGRTWRRLACWPRARRRRTRRLHAGSPRSDWSPSPAAGCRCASQRCHRTRTAGSPLPDAPQQSKAIRCSHQNLPAGAARARQPAPPAPLMRTLCTQPNRAL